MDIEDLKIELDSLVSTARRNRSDAKFYLRILAQIILTHGKDGVLMISNDKSDAAFEAVERNSFEFGDGEVRILPAKEINHA